MNDRQLLRFSRHILLDEIGIEGQERILSASALVVGAGGLGSPAALYLASAGIGRLTICDGDTADLTNLQRQIVHGEASIGLNKAESARRSLAALNSDAVVEAVPERLSGASLRDRVARADVVLDCSDNFATRHEINAACVEFGRPLVSGAAIRFDGQLSVFDLRREDSPCYECLFPRDADSEEMRCAVMGVFAPLVGIVGSAQAAEALKLVAGIGTSLSGRLLILDALSMEWHQVRLARDPGCRICRARARATQSVTN